MKTAITFTTDSTDNHLRALVLALTSSHFMHTATDYALKMLGTCEQLAAGLGAGALKDAKYTSGADTVGNVPLRLWVAERLFGKFLFPLVCMRLMQFSQSCTKGRVIPLVLISRNYISKP